MKRIFIRKRLTSFSFLLFLLASGMAGLHCSNPGGGGTVGPIETPLINTQGALNPSGIRNTGGEQNPQDQKKVAFLFSVATPEGHSNCERTNSEPEVIFPDEKNSPKIQVFFGLSKSRPLLGPKEPNAFVSALGKIRFNPDCPLAVFKGGKAIIVDTVTVVVTFSEEDKKFQTEPQEFPCNAKPQDTPPDLCLPLKPDSEVAVRIEDLVPIEEPTTDVKIITLPPPPSTVDRGDAIPIVNHDLQPITNFDTIDINNLNNLTKITDITAPSRTK